MKIYMTADQEKRLAEFLHEKKSLKALKLGHEYYWRDMARDIGITEETLRHLKNAKGGMNLHTLTALSRSFGRELLDVLEISYEGEPTFKLEG